MSHKLQNYLRSHRKKTGLSQDEVAFLLGCKSGTKVSRYERFSRNPSLETALAYEAVFGTPVRELFAGIFEKVDGKIKKRAQLLAQKLKDTSQHNMAKQKLEILEAITSGRQIGLSTNS